MGKSKLSHEDKTTIQKLFREGVSIPALALKYDVAYVTIKRIVYPEFYAENLAQSAKYNKENSRLIHQQEGKTFRRFSFKLNRTKDAEISRELDRKENVSQYIKELIVADIAANDKSDGKK